MNALLTESEITSRLEQIPHDWKREGAELTAQYTFKDFAKAMAGVNAIAKVAEELNHHPDIDIRWNKVTLRLSTHSAGGLTNADFDFAKRLWDETCQGLFEPRKPAPSP